MKKIETKEALRKEIMRYRKEGKKIGFVPTMGNLHKGHLSLVEECKKENDITLVSIFVNPLQFNRSEDFEKYPRTMKNDLDMLEGLKVDGVFCPSESEIYGTESLTAVMVGGGFMNNLEGYSRPGHFAGVSQVVCKLFNLVQPDSVYFGQKDAQQARIIYQIVKDLDYPIDMKVLPIVRENDGLAMSSRNSRLSPGGRAIAPALFEGLKEGGKAIQGGEREAVQIIAIVSEHLFCFQEIEIDYVMVVDPVSFLEVETISKDVLLVAAIELEGIRLIDNHFVRLS